jgi:hypothetical protein
MSIFRPPLLLSLAMLGMSGCAIRSTTYLSQGQQELILAREAEAPDRAIYAWTMADEYHRKAVEEWGYSDFEAAEQYSIKAAEWAAKAKQYAEAGSAQQGGVDGKLPELNEESLQEGERKPPPTQRPPRMLEKDEPLNVDILDEEE